jgi:hypothetical protein
MFSSPAVSNDVTLRSSGLSFDIGGPPERVNETNSALNMGYPVQKRKIFSDGETRTAPPSAKDFPGSSSTTAAETDAIRPGDSILAGQVAGVAVRTRRARTLSAYLDGAIRSVAGWGI